MRLKLGVLDAEGTPSYGVDLYSTPPHCWKDYFEETGFASNFISPDVFEDLVNIFSYDVIVNPYGAVIPEYNNHLVSAGLKTFLEEGGLLLEVMPIPFYLCYFTDDRTLISMIDFLGGQYNQILTKSGGFDQKLGLTKTGKKILGKVRVPPTVFQANKGAVLSTLYNYSSDPGLPLITTDCGEPVLDILTVGKGRLIRWGCNLELPYRDFLFTAYRKAIEHLFTDGSFKGIRRPRSNLTISISPANYTVGNSTLQRINIAVTNNTGRTLENATIRLRDLKTSSSTFAPIKMTIKNRASLSFKTGFNPQDPQKWALTVSSGKRVWRKKVFTPIPAARKTFYSKDELKNAKPKTYRPKGFDDFWNRTIEEMSKIKDDVKEFLDTKRSNRKYRLYKTYFRSWGNDRIHGWFCRPNVKSKGPAVLLLPGYSDGSKFIPLHLIDRGCAVLALDPRGHGESVRQIERTFPGFMTRGIVNKFKYPYRGLYMDCARAVRYLLSHPSVDEKRVGVMGISQGGGLALLTAALEPRVALTMADSPFLTDVEQGIDVATDGPYAELSQYLLRNPIKREKALENLNFFDVINFADRIVSPVLMCVGLMDTLCPPVTTFSTFNVLRCDKRLDVYPRMGHFCGVYGHQGKKLEWINKYLRLDRCP